MEGAKGQFHGGLWSSWASAAPDCNYLACYIYFTKVANAFAGSGTLSSAYTFLNNIDTKSAAVMGPVNSSGVREYVVNSNGIKDSNGNRVLWADVFTTMNAWLSTNWADYSSYISPTKELERTFVYLMAIHVATDIFAHSAWSSTDGTTWNRLKTETGADLTNIRSKRAEAAQKVAYNTLQHYYDGTDGSLNDFALNTTDYYVFTPAYVKSDDHAFRLGNFLKYAKAINPSAGSLDEFKVPDAARTCSIFNASYGWTLNFEGHSASY